MAKRKHNKKSRLLKKLEENPLITMACNRVGISRATYYRWRDEDPVFKGASSRAIDKGVDKINDFAESKLIENIKANNQPAIAYWLRFNHRRYRPQVLRLVVEENKQQRVQLEGLQQMFEELVNVIGIDKLIDAAMPNPKEFKKKLKKDIEEHRKRLDEL